MEKTVLIEINPTSIKMTTIKLIGGGYQKKIDEIVQNIRLDESIYKNEGIESSKENEIIKILKNYKSISEDNGVTRAYCFASPIFNNIKGQKNLFEAIVDETGYEFVILNNDDQMRMIYNSVLYTVEPPKGVINIVNPDTTYIINFSKRNLLSMNCIPIGYSSLAYKYKVEDGQQAPPNLVEIMTKEVKEAILAVNVPKLEIEEINYVGGGLIYQVISKLVRKMTHYPLDQDNNFNCSMQDFEKALKLLDDYGFDRTKRISNISNERLDNLIAGFAIVRAFLQLNDAKDFYVSTKTVTDGIIASKIIKEYSNETSTDLIDYNLQNIKYFFKIDDSNSDYVYSLAITLFKQLTIIHKLTRKHVKALKIAASMYDCGKRVCFENHSKNSKDIILNSHIYGASHKDLIVAGFACQCQNIDNFSLGDWVKYRGIVDEEDLQAARKIGAIIGLASALDCTKQHKIHDVNCDLLGDIIILKIKVEGEITYEIDEAMKLLPTFKKVYNKSFQII